MRLSDAVREFIKDAQGKDVSLDYLRKELRIDPKSPAFNTLRVIMLRLADDKIIKPSGRKDGIYKVITQVKPIQVFGKDVRPPINIKFPRDYYTTEEMSFARDLVIREGDIILLSGQSNQGKTTLCLNFAGENIDANPVLMGNEYTSIDNEPTSRFMSRLKAMDWIEWNNGTGDKFTLLPVRSDYAEHIVKDRINIIDWINIPTELYMIGSIMEDVKKEVGRGVAIIVIQKAEGTDSGRGGQFTKDFADVEILIDRFGEKEVLLRLGKVKESTAQMYGRGFVYSIENGVKITNFREVIKCGLCHGKGWIANKPCVSCDKMGYVDKKTEEDFGL